MPETTDPKNHVQLQFEMSLGIVDNGPVLPTPPKVAEKAPEKDWRTQVPTVSQLTRRLRGHIENSFFDVWVRGEVSNFKRNVSGHAYFSLKDATSQISVVLFRPQMSKLKFDIKDGVELLAHGKITVYEARGNYQLVCDTLEPVGVGALQLAFQQLKEKLQKEGLFDPAHKKPLPPLPRRVGIITSATGAAVRDILKVLSRRYPNLDILVIPASVQGEKACPEICAALDLAVRWNREVPERALDVLIVGRGGGSLEDMWCFNEEAVARAIHRCPIPIVSAVGHEIDFTIADFVADVRAPTPSAAAEIIVPRKEDLVQQVNLISRRLQLSMLRYLEQLKLHLSHLSQRVVDPREKIRKLRESLNSLTTRIENGMRTRLLFARKRLEAAASGLHLLSPLQVIGRGYSITQTEDTRIVRAMRDVKIGEPILTRVVDGIIESKVTGTRPSEKPPAVIK
jgi:exodeoxyribonuclease VII large subunit